MTGPKLRDPFGIWGWRLGEVSRVSSEELKSRRREHGFPRSETCQPRNPAPRYCLFLIVGQMEDSRILLVNDSASLSERENHPTLDRESVLFRRAFNWILVLSYPLLMAVASLVWLWRGWNIEAIIKAFTSFIGAIVAGFINPVVVIGFGCMWTFGRLASRGWGPRCARHSLLAGLFGLAVFLIGVLSGSIAYIVIFDLIAVFPSLYGFLGASYHPYITGGPHVFLSVSQTIQCIVLPLYLMGMFGAIPAFVLGVIGSFIFRRLLRTHQST